MGRPLKKTLIGNHDGAIKVHYKVAGTEYDGYIVKQISSHRFKVSDGTHPAVCMLVAKANGTLADGDVTITVTDDASVAHRVTKITNHVAVVDTGVTMPWSFSASTTDGKEQVPQETILAITTQPVNTTIGHLATGTLSVVATATDTPINYQWQSSTDSGVTWGNVTGPVYSNATTATLTLTTPDVGKNGFQYRCVVSDADSSVTSSVATLTVT